MNDRSKMPNRFEFVVTAGARARQLLAEVAGRHVEKLEREAKE